MSQIEHVLKTLRVENPSPIFKDGSKWHRTPVDYKMDKERIAFLTNQRRKEWEEIQRYIDHEGCLMSFLRNALDDPESNPCGQCVNCFSEKTLPTSTPQKLGIDASKFLRRSEMRLDPRIMIPKGAFPIYGFSGNMEKEGLSSEPGRILARWGDAGWGKLIADNKHANHFDDVLVHAVVEMIQERWSPEPFPEWVTCVPSLNHLELVPNFAKRLAKNLGIPFIDAVKKVKSNEPQKLKNNSFHQCRNLDGVFSIQADVPHKPVLLVDDIVDSGWTLTVIGALLRKAGSGSVYPLALASTSTG